MNKLKEWLKDKWHWLQTFNEVPTVTIKAGKITFDAEDGYVIVANGRMNVEIDSNKMVVKNLKDEYGRRFTAEIAKDQNNKGEE